MADAAIGTLPKADGIYANSLFVMEQANKAMSTTGEQVAQFAKDSVDDYIHGAGVFVKVGKTTTGAAGTNASVTNSGTLTDPVLDFVIPQGVKGDPGGVTSINGKTGAVTLDSVTGTAGYLDVHYINDNTDLNTITTPGWYNCSTNARAAALGNTPTTRAFFMEVGMINSTTFTQRVIDIQPNDQKIYVRRGSGSSWSDWQREYTTADKPTIGEIGAFPDLKEIVASASARADLNTYTTEGTYGVSASATVPYIDNCPTAAAFSMLVLKTAKATSAVTTRQIIVDTPGNLYIRGATSSGWNNWKQYTSTTVSPATIALDAPSPFDQLRADVDYIAALQGVEL